MEGGGAAASPLSDSTIFILDLGLHKPSRTRCPTPRSAKVLCGAGSQRKGPKGLCREAWPPGLELGVLTPSPAPAPSPLSRGSLRAQGSTSTWAEPEGVGEEAAQTRCSASLCASRAPPSGRCWTGVQKLFKNLTGLTNHRGSSITIPPIKGQGGQGSSAR